MAVHNLPQMHTPCPGHAEGPPVGRMTGAGLSDDAVVLQMVAFFAAGTGYPDRGHTGCLGREPRVSRPGVVRGTMDGFL